MYRCQTCKRRTEDIDEVPCVTKDHPFSPEEITTVHHYSRGPEGERLLACTGRPSKPGVMAIGGRMGLTCIRCKTALKEAALAANEKVEKLLAKKYPSPSETTEAEPEPSLPESEDTDKIPDTDENT
jgi:hypothetical protein